MDLPIDIDMIMSIVYNDDKLPQIPWHAGEPGAEC